MNQKLTGFKTEESKKTLSEGMKKLWEHLKKKGLFSAFTSYEEFRKAKKY